MNPRPRLFKQGWIDWWWNTWLLCERSWVRVMARQLHVWIQWVANSCLRAWYDRNIFKSNKILWNNIDKTTLNRVYFILYSFASLKEPPPPPTPSRSQCSQQNNTFGYIFHFVFIKLIVWHIIRVFGSIRTFSGCNLDANHLFIAGFKLLHVTTVQSQYPWMNISVQMFCVGRFAWKFLNILTQNKSRIVLYTKHILNSFKSHIRYKTTWCYLHDSCLRDANFTYR